MQLLNWFTFIVLNQDFCSFDNIRKIMFRHFAPEIIILIVVRIQDVEFYGKI